MIKFLIFILVTITWGISIQAALYYIGVGCNEEGTNCLFGLPSNRVLNWTSKGTAQELGEHCENFIANIEARKIELGKNQDLVLKYKNFTRSLTSEIQENGQAKIICSVEIHSERADVKVISQTYRTLNWVCENEQSAGICNHYLKECEDLRQASFSEPGVLDSAIFWGGSLLQGTRCIIGMAKIQSTPVSANP